MVATYDNHVRALFFFPYVLLHTFYEAQIYIKEDGDTCSVEAMKRLMRISTVNS